MRTFKVRSHCDGNGIFLCRCRCRHEWVQYPWMGSIPFMTATATEKMSIVESSDGVHTAAVTAIEEIDFFLVLSIAVAIAMWTSHLVPFTLIHTSKFWRTNLAKTSHYCWRSSSVNKPYVSVRCGTLPVGDENLVEDVWHWRKARTRNLICHVYRFALFGVSGLFQLFPIFSSHFST